MIVDIIFVAAVVWLIKPYVKITLADIRWHKRNAVIVEKVFGTGVETRYRTDDINVHTYVQKLIAKRRKDHPKIVIKQSTLDNRLVYTGYMNEHPLYQITWEFKW